jgi:hypothetical protein
MLYRSREFSGFLVFGIFLIRASRFISWSCFLIHHTTYATVRAVPRYDAGMFMSLPCILDDYDVEGFLRVASAFGGDRFGYVVTPNVDHLIRFHDDAAFRALYADAEYVLLDSQFLAHVFRVSKGVRVRVCTGSDLTAQLFRRVIVPDDRVVLIGCTDEQARMLADRYGLKAFVHYNSSKRTVRSDFAFLPSARPSKKSSHRR